MLSIFKSFSSSKKKDCALECIVPETPAVHEFVGPVRIVLVDTTTCTYSCRRLVAALVAAAYFLMGAFHFFSAEAILALNFVNGWSTPLRYRHRVTFHVILQLLALVSAISGTMMISMKNGIMPSISLHAVSS
ncbi:hypothetical protein MSG28_004654 [Choristoneura fumiferana]|uniref:Uncharacterized protein n=1 Tax=Choristoneura fumiferana TaxID=7141 RepID=A0ACC0K6X9_CHOFU|nr:hypothetical protein MSG28_004654 [Choristoneura fumiferana]